MRLRRVTGLQRTVTEQMRRAVCAAVATLAFAVAPSSARAEPTHAEEIAAFANLMANVRTASERCGLTIDEERVAAEKTRLHVEDVDYFAFRKLAAERANLITAKLGTAAATRLWCDEQTGLYGAAGSALPGALRR